MPGLFTLNVTTICAALDCAPDTVRRNLDGAPRRRRGSNHWTLSAVVAAFRQPFRHTLGGKLSTLVQLDNAAREAEGLTGRWDLWVGDQDAYSLRSVLTEAERSRFEVARRMLRRGALDALWLGATSIDEAVWDQALTAPPVLRYVLNDDPCELPVHPADWAKAGATFAMLHDPEPTVATLHFPAPSLSMMKEAA